MNKALHLLEQVPATILVLLAVVSINLGSAIALSQLMGTRVWLAIILISAAAMITSLMARDSTVNKHAENESV